jgi:hypothetical protein
MEKENKKFDVIISEKALEMIIEHATFLSKVSKAAAMTFNLKIIESIKILQYFPERNSWFSDPTISIYKYRKMIIDSRYLVIFQIKGNKVFVEYILDCRKEYKWLL